MKRLIYSTCLAVVLSLTAALGCNGVRSPTGADLAAGVEFGASVVHTVDAACAGVAKGLRAIGRDADAAQVAGACAAPLRDAADGLEAAALAVDAASSHATGDAACAIVGASASVAAVLPILSRHGVKLGAKVNRYLEFATLFGGLCRVGK